MENRHRRKYNALKAAGLLAAASLLFFDEVARQMLVPGALFYAAALAADLYSTRRFLSRGEKEKHPVMAYLLRRLRSFRKAATVAVLAWELPGAALTTALLSLAGRPACSSLSVVLVALTTVHAVAAAYNMDLLG